MKCSVKNCENKPGYLVQVIWKKKPLFFSRCKYHIVDGYEGKIERIKVETIREVKK